MTLVEKLLRAKDFQEVKLSTFKSSIFNPN